MVTYTALTDSYAQIAADVSALKLIQVPRAPDGIVIGIELVVAADTPTSLVRGIELWAGETMTSTQIPDLGASGKLYGRARANWPAPSCGVLTA